MNLFGHSIQPQLPLEEDFDLAMAEAESLKIRTDLMLALQERIDDQGLSAEQAAILLRQPLPRVQNLLNGDVGRFTSEQLIQLLVKIGLSVKLSVISTV